MEPSTVWRKCASCRGPLLFGQTYWVCNVSTCNRKRTGLAFCSVSCWDAHLAVVTHRESWAEERKAPTAAEWKTLQEEEAKPKTRGPRAAAAPDPEPEKPAAAKAAPRVIVRRPGGSTP